MDYESREAQGTAASREVASAPASERYEPPEVAWEEEFEPVAVSNPFGCPGGAPDC